MTKLTSEQEERVRLECELRDLEANVQPFPTPKGIAAHQDRIAELRERIRRLPPLPYEPPLPRLPG